MEQKNILSSLAVARTFIKSQNLKKDGNNTYSKYKYFTPEFVATLVDSACKEANIIAMFSLLKDEYGHYGKLDVVCLESGESVCFQMRTEKPVITATNETQQMGGMNTYTKRYLLMSAFDIEDNSIDFDSNEHAEQRQSHPQPTSSTTEKQWLNKTLKDGTITKEWAAVVAALQNGQRTVKQVMDFYKVNKELQAELNQIANK